MRKAVEIAVITCTAFNYVYQNIDHRQNQQKLSSKTLLWENTATACGNIRHLIINKSKKKGKCKQHKQK